MWIKFMTRKERDMDEEIREVANKVWDKKMGDLSQITGAAMVLGVLAGLESVVANVKKKGKIKPGDMKRAMNNEQIENMIDSFEGEPLNVLGSLSSEQLHHVIDRARENLINTIVTNGSAEEKKLRKEIAHVRDFIENKLSIPMLVLDSIDTRVTQESKPDDFGEQLSKYWKDPTD